MAKLHHATLRAALAVYSVLLTEGKTEAEIKEAISKDPKAFQPDEVEEIYQAIVNPPAPKEKTFKYIVVKSFRDKADFTKEIPEKEDVSSFAADRLNHLVEIGYVEKVEVED